MLFLYILDGLFFLIFSIHILYLLFFSVASRCGKKRVSRVSEEASAHIVVLIPAYKEDGVIEECVRSCLKQDYPGQKFDVVVISDRMTAQTNASLQKLGAMLIPVFFEESTKAKALNFAMAQLDKPYDLALILDADNTIEPDFLRRLDDTFSRKGALAVQAHRRAKNMNTSMALLDAVSEEINNSIFRLGQVNVGLSAALIGSGMCFDYGLFKRTMAGIDAVGGFDRALELTLLRAGYKIDYLPDADVLDEKVQSQQDFTRQRRRWLSAQFHYVLIFLKEIPSAVRERNWDFCNKMFQQMNIPRLILLGFCVIIASVLSFVSMSVAVKWWVLFALLAAALLIAIPGYLFKKELFTAILRLPYFFLVMSHNIFRLRGANKKFIHTSHGVKP